jgi:hypothetical protein
MVEFVFNHSSGFVRLDSEFGTIIGRSDETEPSFAYMDKSDLGYVIYIRSGRE